jgi:chitin synthase
MDEVQPNDSGSPNPFDKRRVRIRSDPSISPNSLLDGVSNTPPTFELANFRDSYVRDHEARVGFVADLSMRGGKWLVGRVRLQCSIRRCIMWKMVEDGLRAAEKGRRRGEDDDESVAPDDTTDYTDRDAAARPIAHRDIVGPGGTHFNESNNNMLLTRMGTNGTQYHDANAEYAAGVLRTPNAGASREYSKTDESGWGSERDKKGRGHGSPNLPLGSKEASMVADHALNTLEGVPTSRARRWWLFMVWIRTSIIP